MRVCVIADDDALGNRISRALKSNSDYQVDPVIHLDQAEDYLSRNKHDVVLVAVRPSAAEASSTITILRDLTPGNLVVVGPVSDPRLVLAVLRQGAVDFIDESSLEAEIPPAFARLKTVRTGRSQHGRLLAVLGSSGGSGATTVTANLAVAMARTHERCLAVDLNPRSGDLASLFDARPTHTLLDLCRVPNRIDRVLFEQTLAKHSSGVSLLAAPRSYEVTYSVESLARVFEVGRSLFPRIIVDWDPTLPNQTIETLRSFDLILIVVRPEFNSLRNAKAILEHLQRKGVDSKKILMVANRVGEPKEIPSTKIEEVLNLKLAAKIPDDPKSAIGSINGGVPVVEEYPSSWISKALLALGASLDATLNAQAEKPG